MSTLTKVFIVLLCVFSIAFTTMTVSIVAKWADWKELANDYQQHAVVADTNLRHMIAANAAELATANDTIKGHLEQIGKLEGQLQASQNEVAQIRSELARAASEKSSSEAMNRGLVAQLQSTEAAREGYRTQRDELERRGIELERRNIDLNDRVNELTARVAVMMEQKRQLEQQINIVRSENENLARAAHRPSAAITMEEPAGAAMGQVTAITPAARSPVRGQVLEVSGDIVTISVGEADGVKKNMVFVVHRGDKYIRDVEITLLDANQSAGRLMGSGPMPRVGDQVTDAMGLGSSRGSVAPGGMVVPHRYSIGS